MVKPSQEVFFEERWQDLLAACEGDEAEARRLLADGLYKAMEGNPKIQAAYRDEVERLSRKTG
jgi:hypothetical protein